MAKHSDTTACHHPAGGWGSAKAVASIQVEEHTLVHGTQWLMHQNKPECNPPIPVWHGAEESKVPAAKSIPVVLRQESRSGI